MSNDGHKKKVKQVGETTSSSTDKTQASATLNVASRPKVCYGNTLTHYRHYHHIVIVFLFLLVLGFVMATVLFTELV